MNKLLNFMLQASIRAFAVAGYSFFGLIVASGDFKLCLSAALFAGGGYFFTELIRYLKIDVNQIKVKPAKKFTFMIFP